MTYGSNKIIKLFPYISVLLKYFIFLMKILLTHATFLFKIKTNNFSYTPLSFIICSSCIHISHIVLYIKYIFNAAINANKFSSSYCLIIKKFIVGLAFNFVIIIFFFLYFVFKRNKYKILLKFLRSLGNDFNYFPFLSCVTHTCVFFCFLF